jgi:sugar/nucleoside kinase (ribokinase family)
MFSRFFFLVLISANILLGSEKAAQDNKKIIGAGLSIFDFFAPVEDSFLIHHSITKHDATHCDPETFDRILASFPLTKTVMPGGSVANTLRGLAMLGKKTAFLTNLGNHCYSEQFAQDLQHLGIEKLGNQILHEDLFRSLCFITPDAERTFLVHIPESQRQTPDLCDTDFQNAHWLHLDIWGLLNGWDYKPIMEKALKHNLRASISLASPSFLTENKEKILDLLSQFQIVFCNEDEMFALTGLKGEAGCQKLQEICPIAVVTLGKNGALVGSKNQISFAPPFPVDAVDTTGAGDLFASGFLYAYFQEAPLPICAKIGNRIASSIVQVVGARLSQEDLSAIQTFIQEELTLQTK